MPSFSIGLDERERIEIELIGIPVDRSTPYDWIEAILGISVGGFTGRVSLMMCVSDIGRFLDELKRLNDRLKGSAEFRTIENQFHMLIKIDQRGHITASGHVRDALPGMGNELSFVLDLDQTFLWRTMSEISTVLRELEERS